MTLQELEKEAAALPPHERLQLIDAVHASLRHGFESPELEQAWAAESQSRMKAYEQGEVAALTVEEVLQRVRTR